MKVIKLENEQEVSSSAAEMVFKKLQEKSINVLGLATGGTVIGFYQYLTEKIAEHQLSLSWLKTVNLDEYIGLENKHPNSYHQFMEKHLFQFVDIPPEQCFLPNGEADSPDKEAEKYEELVTDLGVDLQILGVGVNGHIGFNEPGSAFHGKTRVVDLAASTIEANARFFEEGEEVPEKAITMGISTIMQSKQIILLASGKEKAAAVKEIISGEIREEVPGTVLQRHPDVTVIADEEALSDIQDD